MKTIIYKKQKRKSTTLLLVFSLFFIVSAATVSGYLLHASATPTLLTQDEVISKLRKHVDLPTTSPEAVVRVTDKDPLKDANPFFKNAENGDYIIIYPSVAAIYNVRTDQVKNVVVVRKEAEK